MSEIKYKHIKLKISQKVFRDVQNSLIARGLADNTDGITDQVLIKIIRHMTDNKKEVQIEYKKEREK
tara:strand:- start:1175 stop:1375 length:201 start_codon:yes stop_codon:yes gene_type:complete